MMPDNVVPPFAIVQVIQIDRLDNRFSNESNQGEKMINHLKEQQELLKSQGINSSYFNDGEEQSLCWFGVDNARYSLSIWPDDLEAYLTVAKNGEVIQEKDFSNAEFLLVNF